MMYKEKKISKFALICCSILIALSTMLAINPSWLNKVYDTTLCASSTAPTIDSTYFDYKSPNYLEKFDAYVDFVSFSNGNGSGNLSLYLVSSTSMPTYSDMPTTFYFYTTNSFTGVTTLSSTTFSTKFQSAYGSKYISFTTTTTSYSSTNISNVFVINVNSTYYTVCGNTLYSKHIAYQEGLADADTSTAYQNGYTAGQTDGYNSGYTTGKSDGIAQGQNNVINNPNDYDLYTQSQYDSNYTNGYNAGVIQGQNNVINNPHNFGLFTQADLDNEYNRGYRIGQEDIEVDPNSYGYYTDSQYQNNYDNGYRDGQESSTNYQDGITQGQNNVINNPHNYGLFTQADLDNEYNRGYADGVNYTTNLYDGYGNFLYSKFYWTDDSDYNTPLVYNGVNSSNYVLSGEFSNHTNLFDKLPGGFSISGDYVAMITDLDGNEYLVMDGNILWFEFYNSVSVDKFPTMVIPGSQRLGSDYIVQLVDGTTLYYNGADTVFDGINLSSYTGNYIKRVGISAVNIQDYFDTSDGLAFNTRDSYTYQLGFSEGYSEGDSNGYKKGYNSGYGVGRSDGINSAEGNTFTSLIMAVVDAPINMFKSLFNFDILGFNLLGFATGIFTLCVFIFIIKKFIGK